MGNNDMRDECREKFGAIATSLDDIKTDLKTMSKIMVGNGNTDDSFIVRFALVEQELRDSRGAKRWWGKIGQSVIVAVVVAAIFFVASVVMAG